MPGRQKPNGSSSKHVPAHFFCIYAVNSNLECVCPHCVNVDGVQVSAKKKANWECWKSHWVGRLRAQKPHTCGEKECVCDVLGHKRQQCRMCGYYHPLFSRPTKSIWASTMEKNTCFSDIFKFISLLCKRLILLYWVERPLNWPIEDSPASHNFCPIAGEGQTADWWNWNSDTQVAEAWKSW